MAPRVAALPVGEPERTSDEIAQRQNVAEEARRGPGDANAPPQREGMNAEEVAAFLGVDRKTVYEYANRGKIPHQRLGKRLLFSRQALVAWLGACKVASSRHRER